MVKSAEHAACPFLASANRMRKFVREHALADRPHTSLWLAKTYVIPAGMYGSQLWGTGFLQAGREFSSLLSTLHLHFLKGTLGFHKSLTLIGLYSKNVDMNRCSSTSFGQLSSFSIVCTISDTLRRVVQANLNLQPRSSACWIAQPIAERFSRTAWVRVVCTSCSNWACYYHARVYCRFEA